MCLFMHQFMLPLGTIKDMLRQLFLVFTCCIRYIHLSCSYSCKLYSWHNYNHFHGCFSPSQSLNPSWTIQLWHYRKEIALQVHEKRQGPKCGHSCIDIVICIHAFGTTTLDTYLKEPQLFMIRVGWFTINYFVPHDIIW